MDKPTPIDESRFVRRVLIAVAVVALAAAVFSVVSYAWNALLTVFAGMLIAVLIDAIVSFVARHTRLPRPVAFGAVTILLVGAAVGFWWWVGSIISRQLSGITEQAMAAWQGIEGWLSQSEWGTRALSEFHELSESGVISDRIGGVLTSTLGALGTALLVVVFAMYFAIAPDTYIDGALHLVPEPRRPRMREVVAACGKALRSWFLGRFISMAFVAIGTAIGLWIADVPMPIGLALIAGLLAFVPNVGPIVAGIPGVLVGLSQGTSTALWAIAVYTIVQAIDNYVFTPFIDQRVVSMPPALLLAFQLLLGLSSGLLGLFMATPLAVALVVLVQALYVRDVLGDAVPLPGEREETEQ